MNTDIRLEQIDLLEILHFLGWRGTPVEQSLIDQINACREAALSTIQPRMVYRKFLVDKDGSFCGTTFAPLGNDVPGMLCGCSEAILMAATLGAESEMLLLRYQAADAAKALLMDAVLSAGIEAVCDEAEAEFRRKAFQEGLYLTDRFSPGYGDMPIRQSAQICSVLSSDRAIGLTVSGNGILIPRKSVTAVMGISKEPVKRRARGCQVCSARNTCAMRRNEE